MAVLSDYVERAMAEAVYDKLEDNSFAGRIPSCLGVISFGTTLQNCQEDLRSALEDWILLGLKLRHPLPVIGGIDLNKRRSILELQGLGKELWEGVDAQEYVDKERSS